MENKSNQTFSAKARRCTQYLHVEGGKVVAIESREENRERKSKKISLSERSKLEVAKMEFL